MSAHNVNPRETDGLCLLSLDGGGVRGLSSLFILKNIMDRMNHTRKQVGDHKPKKPCEVFDMIGGTSTGGLIAIMLGRLEMSVDECISAYIEITESIFKKKKRSMPFGFSGKIKGRFDSAKLETAIRETIQKRKVPEDAPFKNENEQGCKTFVCTIDQDTKRIVLLRSYDMVAEPSIPVTICDAARATSAATTFFEPIRVGNRTFADGALGANNPVEHVEDEATNVWCPESAELKPMIKCFISIGTGNPGVHAFESNIAKFLGQTVVKIATETEETEKKFIDKWRKVYNEDRYFRFNVDQGLQDIGLAEYLKAGPIEAATDRYLVNQAQKSRGAKCIQNLSLKQNTPDPSLTSRLHAYDQAATISKQSRFRYPSLQVHNFIARDAIIKEMRQYLEGPQDNFTPNVFVLLGMGGCGKTQLALEYCRRAENEAWYSAVFWLDADSPATIAQSFAGIAHGLGKPDVKTANEDDNLQFVLQRIKT